MLAQRLAFQTIIADWTMRLLAWCNGLRRRQKTILAVTIDGAIACVAAAVWLRLFARLCGCGVPADIALIAPIGFAILLIATNRLSGVYHQVLRHFDGRRLLPITAGTLAAAAIGGVVLALQFAQPEVALLPLLWLSIFGPLIGWRLLAAGILNLRLGAPGRPVKRIAVYGAGLAAAQLLQGLARETDHRAVVLVDDNPDLWGRKLHGLVIGSPADLPTMVAANLLDQIVIAMPSASAARRGEILNCLAELQVEVRTLPSMREIMTTPDQTLEMRPVRPEELLSREPVVPDFALMARELRDRSVLVTGGGGSIGGALCREIIRHQPKRLVIFEVSEFALYTIDREVRGLLEQLGLTGEIEVVPVLGSVLRSNDIDRAISANGVDIVYHGAAYKHVPLVEGNPLRGVDNNVFGTLNTAEAVLRHGVRRMVVISTDKAVRPTSVMGASKRVAEKVVESLHRRGGATSFALVRFGNVLDSAGSVVPLFREQLAKGGPLTVTHAEVVRFFMTIQEAAELVIQAGAMSSPHGCEVYHLDMGEPVRISDLARKLIHLTGHRVREPGKPNGDIEIKYVGLRPGEKLFEELLVNGDSQPTSHPRIFRAHDALAEWSEMQNVLRRLRNAIEADDPMLLKRTLAEVVESYRPELRKEAAASRPSPALTVLAG